MDLKRASEQWFIVKKTFNFKYSKFCPTFSYIQLKLFLWNLFILSTNHADSWSGLKIKSWFWRYINFKYSFLYWFLPNISDLQQIQNPRQKWLLLWLLIVLDSSNFKFVTICAFHFQYKRNISNTILHAYKSKGVHLYCKQILTPRM